MSDNIFFQLENCEFNRDITLEECRILVNFFPDKVAAAIKILVDKNKKQRDSFLRCSTCNDKYENQKSLMQVQMYGESKELCFECNSIWQGIKKG